MHNKYLRNKPITNATAVSIEQKCPHEMLQTPWIILYWFIQSLIRNVIVTDDVNGVSDDLFVMQETNYV